MAQMKHLDAFYVVELLEDWNVNVPSWKYPRSLKSPRVSSPGFGNDSKMMVIRQRPSSPYKHCRRMSSIGGYHPYGLASILAGFELNRACVGYAWSTSYSPSTSSHLSTGTSEGIA
ncbi:nibrin [Trichonephila clavipes]|nr:nibrin [Trichonephila clavipes]